MRGRTALIAFCVFLWGVALGHKPEIGGPAFAKALFVKLAPIVSETNETIYPKVVIEGNIVHDFALSWRDLEKTILDVQHQIPIVGSNDFPDWHRNDGRILRGFGKIRTDNLFDAVIGNGSIRLANIIDLNRNLEPVWHRASLKHGLEWLPVTVRLARQINAQTMNDEFWQLQSYRSLGANFSGGGGAFGDSNRGFEMAGLSGYGVEQPSGKDGQDTVEQNQQPISEMLSKSVVPITFIVSLMGLLLAARNGGAIAGLIVGGVSLGWLCLIVFYGLL